MSQASAKEKQQKEEEKEGLQYCGERNCYSVLGLKNYATISEVRKAFRKLSLKYHPDRSKNPKHTPLFIAANHAHEVLSDSAVKADYDDMLRNPQNYYTNSMRFYKHKMKKMKPLTVVYGVILLISLLHFMYWRSRHFKVLDQIRANPQARAKLDALEQERVRVRREELEAKGLNPFTEADPEAAPAKVVARERANVLTFADIKGWQGRAPTLLDTLPVWLFWLPGAIMENIVWMFKFSVFKMSPSNDYEANYLTAQAMGTEWHEWKKLGLPERSRFVCRKLWVAENKAVLDQEKKARKRR
jgi:DnaJ family protein C protein 25